MEILIDLLLCFIAIILTLFLAYCMGRTFGEGLKTSLKDVNKKREKKNDTK